MNVKPLISHEFRLDDAPQTYQTIMDENGGASLAVVLKYPITEKENHIEAFQPIRKIVVSSEPIAKDELKFALVGAGNLAKWSHLPALQKVKGVHLHAVHSNSGARGKSYAMRFGRFAPYYLEMKQNPFR